MATLTTSDGTTLSYLFKKPHHGENSRNQPAVIFLHGWCANALEWLPFAEALKHRHPVICWNARAHGREQVADNADMSLSRMAEDLDQLIRTEAPQGAVLVGHSMGALTAWAWLRDFDSTLLKGLCIIDQSPCLLTSDHWQFGIYGNFSADRNRHFIQRLQEDFADTVVRLIFSRLDKNQPLPGSSYQQRLHTYLQGLPAGLLTRCWESLTRTDLRHVLPDIKVPTLLMYGDRSQFYGPDLARWVHRQIPGSRLIRYPEADHSPHVREGRRMIADLSSFLDALAEYPAAAKSETTFTERA